MSDIETETELLTLGGLKALLESFDLPDDTVVLMEADDLDDWRETREVRVSRVVASRGYGEASRIVFCRPW